MSTVFVTRSHSHSPKNVNQNRLKNQQEDPTKEQWDELITPPEGEGDAVEIGRRSRQGTPTTIKETRERVAKLGFHAIDPYVASVAAGVGAGRVEIPRGEVTVDLNIPDYYAEEVEVRMATPNGEDAPMMVILPGIHGDGKGSHSKVLKKAALERGMNYVVFPNSLSPEMMDDEPIYHPGNPRVDAMASHQLIGELKKAHPQYFEEVSVAGYSYGALHGANIARFQEEGAEPLVNGSVVAISPPDNLDNSMNELDGLRELYKKGSGSIIWQGLKYKRHVKKYGYEKFMKSDLSERGQGTNITEIKIADKYGSRSGMEDMVEMVDKHFGHNRLPKHTREYRRGSDSTKRRLRSEHNKILKAMTYDQFGDEWMVKDKWLQEQGMTPEEMAAEFSFKNAMDVIDDTPMLVMASADDYILAPQDVETLKELEASPGPLEVVRIFEHGGHVGIDWNPDVQDVIGDFAFAPPPERAAD